MIAISETDDLTKLVLLVEEGKTFRRWELDEDAAVRLRAQLDLIIKTRRERRGEPQLAGGAVVRESNAPPPVRPPPMGAVGKRAPVVDLEDEVDADPLAAAMALDAATMAARARPMSRKERSIAGGDAKEGEDT